MENPLLILGRGLFRGVVIEFYFRAGCRLLGGVVPSKKVYLSRLVHGLISSDILDISII